MGKGFASPAQYRGDDVKPALISNWRALTTHLNSYVPTFNADGTTLALPGDLDVAGALTVGTLPAIDHGADLDGLADDDHTQYSRADGTRAFTGVVSGVTPTADAHLATKGYVDDGPAWVAFTPTWDQSTTSPTLGNGDLKGAYFRIGDMVTMMIYLQWGSTTTNGTGYQQFSLPSGHPAASVANPSAHLGAQLTQQGLFYDSSLGDWYVLNFTIGTGGVVAYTHNLTSLTMFLFTHTNPVSTPATGDQVRMRFTYQAQPL